MTSIAIGSLIWREVTWPHHVSMLRLMQQRPDINPLVLAGDALVSRARGIVATRFLKTETEDVLLFIDSDIQFDPRDAVKVCEQAHEIRGIVGAAYTVRRGEGSFPACMLKQGEPVTFYDPYGPDLVDVEYLSGGFMAISRRVLQQVALYSANVVEGGVPKPLHEGTGLEHWPMFRPFSKGSIELSEDWAFCERARVIGLNIKLNPKVRLRHIGQVGFHMEDMLSTYVPNTIVRVTFDGKDYTAENVA